MKAMRADRFGGPEQLRLVDATEAEPAAGQVRVLVRSAGLNPADLVRLSGLFPGIGLPYIPGTDVSGEIDEVGAGVNASRIGERVYDRAFTGGYAEKTCMLASEAIPLPSSLSFAEGSGIPIPFFTAYHALHNKARLQPGETVLISGGGGGVGVAAIQLAKIGGARVITTCGSAEKCDRAIGLGADVAVNYRERDFVEEVKTFTAGAGVDVVIENVAADNFARDFEAISKFGRIVIIGTGTGRSSEASFNIYSALTKDITFFGMSLVNVSSHVLAFGDALNKLFGEKRLRVIISKSYSLSQAAEALNDLVAGRVFGKLVLNVST
jgi:NADPH:quinone reductase-like Zn-dependent oxidoreductase